MGNETIYGFISLNMVTLKFINMKVIILSIVLSTFSFSYSQDSKMGKDGDNLDLYATLELFKNAITSASHLRAKICYLGISMEIQSIPKVV